MAIATKRFDYWLIILSALILAIGNLGILVIIQKTPLISRSHPAAKFLANLASLFILYSLADYENIFWAFQTAWFLIYAITIWSVILIESWLNETHFKRQALMATYILAVLASFSSSQGLIVWVAITTTITIHMVGNIEKKSRKRDFQILGITIILAFATAFVYLNGFDRSYLTATVPGKSAPNFAVETHFFLLALAGPITAALNLTANITQLIGAALVIMAIALMALRTIPTRPKEPTSAEGYLAFALIFYVLVTLGRAKLGLAEASSSRYSLYALPLGVLIPVLVGNYIYRLIVYTKTPKQSPELTGANVSYESHDASTNILKYAFHGSTIITIASLILICTEVARIDYRTNRVYVNAMTNERTLALQLIRTYPNWNSTQVATAIYPSIIYIDPLVQFYKSYNKNVNGFFYSYQFELSKFIENASTRDKRLPIKPEPKSTKRNTTSSFGHTEKVSNSQHFRMTYSTI